MGEYTKPQGQGRACEILFVLSKFSPRTTKGLSLKTRQPPPQLYPLPVRPLSHPFQNKDGIPSITFAVSQTKRRMQQFSPLPSHHITFPQAQSASKNQRHITQNQAGIESKSIDHYIPNTKRNQPRKPSLRGNTRPQPSSNLIPSPPPPKCGAAVPAPHATSAPPSPKKGGAPIAPSRPKIAWSVLPTK